MQIDLEKQRHKLEGNKYDSISWIICVENGAQKASNK